MKRANSPETGSLLDIVIIGRDGKRIKLGDAESEDLLADAERRRVAAAAALSLCQKLRLRAEATTAVDLRRSLLTPDETAIMLGITPRTFASWRRQNRGPAPVYPFRRLLYDPAVVVDWLRTHPIHQARVDRPDELAEVLDRLARECPSD